MFTFPGLPTAAFKNIKVTSVKELRGEERKVDSFILNFVEGLKDETIGGTFESFDVTNKWRFTLGQIHWHLIEEELRHRSELNALFWQLDLDPPITDWLDWKIEIREIRETEQISSICKLKGFLQEYPRRKFFLERSKQTQTEKPRDKYF
jgi:uncharacterized damage-inducible protein DinB